MHWSPKKIDFEKGGRMAGGEGRGSSARVGMAGTGTLRDFTNADSGGRRIFA